mgnify:CR=1 FL=1
MKRTVDVTAARNGTGVPPPAKETQRPTMLIIPGNNGGKPRMKAPFFKTKKLAIIGSTASMQFAPFQDPSWTLAAHPCSRPECSREPDWYFDMHRPECFTLQRKRWNNRYFSWLKNLQTPIFMQEDSSSMPTWKRASEFDEDGNATKYIVEASPWSQIPMAVRYPKDRILAEYRGYFSNHVAWMIALAMTEGVTHIGLFGCQYSSDSERSIQRGSCEYWLGRFEQSGGILVEPKRYNDLLNIPAELYGYESHGPDGKLVDAYRVKGAPTLARAVAGDAGAEMVALTVIDTASAVGRPPLMELPNGESPAWERSGLEVDDAGNTIIPEEDDVPTPKTPRPTLIRASRARKKRKKAPTGERCPSGWSLSGKPRGR